MLVLSEAACVNSHLISITFQLLRAMKLAEQSQGYRFGFKLTKQTNSIWSQTLILSSVEQNESDINSEQESHQIAIFHHIMTQKVPLHVFILIISQQCEIHQCLGLYSTGLLITIVHPISEVWLNLTCGNSVTPLGIYYILKSSRRCLTVISWKKRVEWRNWVVCVRVGSEDQWPTSKE